MSKAKPEPDTSSEHKPDTNTYHTPQPSTPIKHAGSNCLIGEGEQKIGLGIREGRGWDGRGDERNGRV